uniref:Uncharacterized protein n=1 Tax=Cacopsylla melanoneura TaxID=428564 RepID=A0A8D8XJA0_9HEMI
MYILHITQSKQHLSSISNIIDLGLYTVKVSPQTTSNMLEKCCTMLYLQQMFGNTQGLHLIFMAVCTYLLPISSSSSSYFISFYCSSTSYSFSSSSSSSMLVAHALFTILCLILTPLFSLFNILPPLILFIPHFHPVKSRIQ